MHTATARIVIHGDVEGVGVLSLFLYFLLQSLSLHPVFQSSPLVKRPLIKASHSHQAPTLPHKLLGMPNLSLLSSAGAGFSITLSQIRARSTEGQKNGGRLPDKKGHFHFT